MPDYDSKTFKPPAPLAQVTLRHPETGATLSDVTMLIDSGADVTIIPQAALGLLGAAVIPDKHYEVIAFDGNRSVASVVQLELVFCGRTFRGQFLLIDQP